MVSGPAAQDAIERARRLPSLRLGLHLVLVDGVPVLPPERIPNLVDATGRLRSDLAMTGIDIFFRRGVREQLAAEIEAQFDAYRATGLPLDHVNAHHHFHVHPLAREHLLATGRRYGMRGVRVPMEPARILARVEPGASPPRAWLLMPWAARLARRVRECGLAMPDHVFGMAWSGAMTEQRVAGLLSNLPDGISEIYCHPSIADRFAGATPGYRYTDEVAALTAPRVIELLHAAGARSGGYRDLADR
jgi:hopanoid biosynthesis associated protein HpnK